MITVDAFMLMTIFSKVLIIVANVNLKNKYRKMSPKTNFLGIVFVSCIRYATMMFPHMNMGHSAVPIEVKSVDVTTSLSGCTNVSVSFTAMENVTALWTVNEGFLPRDLNGQSTTNVYKTGKGKVASICLPTDMKFDSIRLHLICEMHSFELHLSLQVSHNMTSTQENVKQYVLMVPQSNEIGISSRGEARFHVMVDTSGTKFSFGMLQAEATLLYGTIALHDSAFSFLPDNKNKMLRLRKIAETGTEYHTDVVIKSANLQKSKTMISVSVACSQPQSIVQRLDMKHVTYLKRNQVGFSASQKHPVAVLGEQKQELLNVAKNGNVLLRCRAFGFPRPNITLHKKEGNKIRSHTVPSYTTSLEFEKTTVFQILNATASDSGHYICKTSNGLSSAEKTYTVKVQ
ncbi:uncharacterized protein LOC123547861 [Mercenaria mercenaria]|uniref:uncharacterized protein LOC123547861 n=1 Tax=Mercenaria mercenaria TaxID=6596 RepID=UPI00234F679A|nr:uncharacterized protein LOC123547861 [Mercenaria mercenaria]